MRRYGPVRGVLHSTIVLGDQSLARMDEERFGATYAAKADVAVNIAEVFAGDPLDFVVFFSSLQSFLTSPGQANYAAGCTFADAYAEHLGTRLSCPVKVMHWGYWGGVGVAADEAHRERMAKGGVASIEPAEGMAAYDTLLGFQRSQLAMMKVTNTRAFDGLLSEDVIEHVAPVSPEVVGLLRDSRAAAALDPAVVVDSTAGHVNEVLAESLVDYVRHRVADDPMTTLRVLEIGSGDREVRDTVFRHLGSWRDHLETYCHTGLSEESLETVRQEFGETAHYFETRVFDVGEPLAGQAVQADTFDVVIATGLRDVTPDLRVALRNAKAALRANGILLLSDPTSVLPRLLAEAGFRGTFTAAEGQQVLIAESDGAVRQPRNGAGPVEVPETVLIEQDEAPGTVAEQVTALLADVLELDPAQLELDAPLRRYGFDSIFMAQFLSQLRKHVDDTLSLDVIAECESLRDVLAAVGATSAPVLAVEDHPELIQMNRGREGRPVFWIHHGNGGVESYRPLAERSGRPFYGIQPRGWAGSGEMLGGQVPMARHYVSLIRAVQPEGPYDIGGFSLGGLLAYEVVRQLQLQGAEVNTLVMLDSLDAPATNQVNAIMQGGRTEPDAVAKVSAFRAVNLVLGNNSLNTDTGTTPILHRDEVDPGLSYPDFFDSLIKAALAAGITKTEAQLRKQVTQLARYFEAMQSANYVTSRLPRRDSVSCHYFRNRSGEFFGEFKDYMVLFDNPELPGMDGVEYWRDWKSQIDDFRVTVVDTNSHADVMTAPQSLDEVLRLCDEIYAHDTEAVQPAA